MFLSLSMMTSVVSKTLLYYGTEGVVHNIHVLAISATHMDFIYSYQFHELILDKAESALRHGEGMHFTVSCRSCILHLLCVNIYALLILHIVPLH